MELTLKFTQSKILLIQHSNTSLINLLIAIFKMEKRNQCTNIYLLNTNIYKPPRVKVQSEKFNEKFNNFSRASAP